MSSSCNRLRGQIRAESKINPLVEQSLQPCLISQNRGVLLGHLARLKDKQRRQNLKALLYIWDSLLAEVDGRPRSFMSFMEGYDVYIAFSEFSYAVDVVRREENMKKTFQTLLHPSHGLRILIINSSWILLHPDTVNLSDLIPQIMNSKSITVPIRENVSQVMGLMETEWDRKLLRYLLSLFNSRSQLKELGISGKVICPIRKSVENLVGSLSEIELEAEKNVEQEMGRRRVNLVKEVTRQRRLLAEKNWNDSRHCSG